MHKGCLQLSLGVVKEHHEDAELLIQSQCGIASIDRLAEGEKGQGHNNGAGVFDIEDSFPADLRAQVLEIECHGRRFYVVAELLGVVSQGCTACLIYSESQSRGVEFVFLGHLTLGEEEFLEVLDSHPHFHLREGADDLLFAVFHCNRNRHFF